MAIFQRVENHLPHPPPADDAQRTQKPQVLRDGGLPNTDNLSQVADAERLIHQRVNDFGARRVGQGAERLSYVDVQLVAEQSAASRADTCGFGA